MSTSLAVAAVALGLLLLVVLSIGYSAYLNRHGDRAYRRVVLWVADQQRGRDEAELERAAAASAEAITALVNRTVADLDDPRIAYSFPVHLEDLGPATVIEGTGYPPELDDAVRRHPAKGPRTTVAPVLPFARPST